MQLSDISVLTIQEAQALSAPPETALGLPGRAYFAKDFYEAERRNVFAAGWMGVGFASDLKEPGATKSISIAVNRTAPALRPAAPWGRSTSRAAVRSGSATWRSISSSICNARLSCACTSRRKAI